MKKENDNMLNLLIIADTHGAANVEEFSHIEENCKREYGACFFLGDVSSRDFDYILPKIRRGAPIYGILGNHDNVSLLSRYGIENLHGRMIILRGISFVGFEGSLRYKDENAPLYTDKESVVLAKELPKADVLLSHDAPKGIYKKDAAHSGLSGLRWYLKRHPRCTNIHGHHHKNDENRIFFAGKSIGVYGSKIITIEK